jgi:hypothetical protein
MPLTAEQMKTLIVEEVYREDTPAFLVTIKTSKVNFRARLNDWWTLYEDKHAVNVRLGYLYVKRHALEFLRDSVWARRTHRAFDRYSYDSDLAKIFLKMIDQVSMEINILEGNKVGGRDGLYWTGTTVGGTQTVNAAGEVTTISPIAAAVAAGTIAAGGADPNSQAYIGSPVVSAGTSGI